MRGRYNQSTVFTQRINNAHDFCLQVLAAHLRQCLLSGNASPKRQTISILCLNPVNVIHFRLKSLITIETNLQQIRKAFVNITAGMLNDQLASGLHSLIPMV